MWIECTQLKDEQLLFEIFAAICGVKDSLQIVKVGVIRKIKIRHVTALDASVLFFSASRINF